MNRLSAEPVITERWAAFIQGGVAIVGASRDPHNVTAMCRVLGCRVAGNRQKVTLLVNGQQAEPLIRAIRSTGTIAAVFSQPSTHISVQLKGSDATVTATRPTDVQVFKRYVEVFVAETTPLGYPEDLIRRIMWSEPPDLKCITFTPANAFLQTPGPRAGEPLRS